MNCLVVQLFVCCVLSRVLSRLEHKILINIKRNPKELQNSWNVYTLSMNNGGSLAGKLVLLEWYKTLFHFSFMPLCIGIPVGMARLSVVARIILVYGWLPSPFYFLLRILYLPVQSYFFIKLWVKSRVKCRVLSPCLLVY